MAQVELDDLVASARASVLHVDPDEHLPVAGDSGFRRRQVREGKRGVAQAVAEGYCGSPLKYK